MKERETEIVHLPVSATLELHAKILHFTIVWFNHDSPLPVEHVAQPSSLVVVKAIADKTDSPSAAAPRGFDNNFTVFFLQFLNICLLLCNETDTRRALHLQIMKHRHCVTTMGQLANVI